MSTAPASDAVSASNYASSVTTLAAAARIATDRYRRFTAFGRIPVIRWLTWPWIWPLMLITVGARAGAIHHTPAASLEIADGHLTKPHLTSVLLGVAALVAFAGAVDAVTVLLALNQKIVLHVWALMVPSVGIIVLFVLLGLAKIAFNPQAATLGRRRRKLARDTGRPVLVLTSLVANHDRARAALNLALRAQEAWRPDCIVIGYPATKKLIRYYVLWGARRDGNTGRRMQLDYQHPRRLMKAPPP